MSVAPYLSLTELTEKALKLLIQEMGVVNTARFINQFHTGTGDSVEEKERLYGAMTVDELAAGIKTMKEQGAG